MQLRLPDDDYDLNKKKNDIPEDSKDDEKTPEKSAFEKKISYFYDYYKVHVIIGIIAIIAIVYVFNSIHSHKPSGFNAYIINSYGISGDELEKMFVTYASLDTESNEYTINSSLTMSSKLESPYDMGTSQVLDSLISQAELDVLAFDSQAFYTFGLQSYYIDLSTVLSEEDMELWKDHLYYIDMADYDYALENADEFGLDMSKVTYLTESDDIKEEAESHRYPDTMIDPVPIGIFLDDSGLCQNTICYSGKIPVVGIIANSQRPDLAVKFLHFMWDYE